MRRSGALGFLIAILIASCGLEESGGLAPSNAGGASGAPSGGGVAGSAGTTQTGGTAGSSTGGVGGDASVETGGMAGSAIDGAAGSIADVVEAGDPCNGACVDSHASCATGTCTCVKGYADTDGGDPTTAFCTPAVTKVRVKIGIDHARLGNLTIKLFSPTGKSITLMSRPGFTESADDGGANGATWPPFNYGPSGDQSDLDSTMPITFDDAAATSAEDMGKFQDGSNLAVCRDKDNVSGGAPAPICDYHPAPDSAGGASQMAVAFDGELPAGTWRLCVGDSDPATSGTLQSWEIEVETPTGALPTAVTSSLSLTIPEDGYDGTMTSMGCADLAVS